MPRKESSHPKGFLTPVACPPTRAAADRLAIRLVVVHEASAALGARGLLLHERLGGGRGVHGAAVLAHEPLHDAVRRAGRPSVRRMNEPLPVCPCSQSASCLSGWTPILDDQTSFRHCLLHCNGLCTHPAAADAVRAAVENG